MASNLTFSEALEHLKQNHRVWREGWNGKGMFLFIVRGDTVKGVIDERYGEDWGKPEREVHDAIYMQTAQGSLVPWLASQTDMLANDWISG